jgi:hypothetical protein
MAVNNYIKKELCRLCIVNKDLIINYLRVTITVWYYTVLNVLNVQSHKNYF